MVAVVAEGVEVEEALIHHLLQAVEAVPQRLVPLVVVVVLLLLRQEVEEVEQMTGHTDQVEVPARERQMEALQQAVVAGQPGLVLSIAKRDQQLINDYTISTRWISTLE